MTKSRFSQILNMLLVSVLLMGVFVNKSNAQTSVDLTVSSLYYSNHPGGYISGYGGTEIFNFTLTNNDFIHTISTNQVSIEINVPTGVEIEAVNLAWVPIGWTYVAGGSSSQGFLVNSAPIAPFPFSITDFHVPLNIVSGTSGVQISSINATYMNPTLYVDPNTSDNYNDLELEVANWPLPIEFTAFDLTINDCQVNLSWTGKNSFNNNYFEVQRSVDGKNFEPLTQVTAENNSGRMESYGYTDQYPIIGTNLYRIVQFDFDGSTTYTKVLVANVNCKTSGDIVAYPNPAKESLNIKGLSQNDKIEVYNVLGQKVFAVDAVKALEQINIVNLVDGIYNLRVVRGGADVYTLKFVKK